MINFEPPDIPDPEERKAHFEALVANAASPQAKLEAVLQWVIAELDELAELNPEKADRIARRVAERINDTTVDVFRLHLDLWDQQGGDKL